MPLPINKISKIHISNFKFFDKNRVIDLEGKDHLLLYGENGSGKSSIYWALYTLLDSSIKDNQGQIEKYFKKGGKRQFSKYLC
ncbi:MAG: AAA family ATPase [Bacteroidetes bacterium]|nr:AAA family ATPase [Bacteroidota bacterium]